jgi:Fe-S-cluster-containing dehydrogenase component
MKTWNLIFDVDRCNNCNNCLLATKDEYVGNDFPGYSAPLPKLGTLLLTVKRKERGQAPMIDVAHYVETCHQCKNPTCVNKKSEGAVFQRDDGIVIIDPEKAKGRRDIVSMCPYGQIFWNEELDIPQKWTFDAHLLDAGWKEPRCAQVCPTGALTALKITDEDMAKRVEAEALVVLRPELGNAPRVFYKNFGRINACFIGGSLYGLRDGEEKCLEGLQISLSNAAGVSAQAQTDAFGDFRFDGLKPNSGDYTITVSTDLGTEVSLNVTLGESVFIGAVEV